MITVTLIPKCHKISKLNTLRKLYTFVYFTVASQKYQILIEEVIMKKNVLLVLFVAMLLQAKDVLVFSSSPYGDKDKLIKAYQTVLDYIGEQTGLKFQFVISMDYERLQEEVNSGIVDVGVFPPMNYIKVKENYPNILYLFTTLDKKGSSSYKSYIITKKGNNITSYKNLKDKTFAFVEENSASGYLFPYSMMSNTWKIDPETYFTKTIFVGNHPNVMKAVSEGYVDGGAVAQTQYQRNIGNYPDPKPFLVIDSVVNIPFDAVCASPKLDQKTTEKIRDVFLKLNTKTLNKEGKSVLGGLAAGGFGIHEDKFYDIVRETAKIFDKLKQK